LEKNMARKVRLLRATAAFALLAVSLAAAAQQQPVQPLSSGGEGSKAERVPDPAALPTPELQLRNPRYQVRPGDSFDLVFSFTPEFNQTVTVQPDGFVSLRDVGDVHVLGKTVPELTRLINTTYANILRDPSVSVVLKDFEKPHFVVSGQVTRPGKYELRADTTAMEAVAIAGGFNGMAKHSQVLLFRRVSDDWVEVKKLDLKRIHKGDIREDVHLRPGDMLFVPQSAFSKIRPFLPTWGMGAYINPTN
jgi:polysaccharide export outer membrane protein